MKTSKIILIALLALPAISFAKDEPKFSSGFSSGKSTSTAKHQPSDATPKPVKSDVGAAKQSSATNVGTAKSSFGSFGGAKTAKATSVPASSATPAATSTNAVTPVKAKSTSALTQSLEKSAAQSNALKALDMRNAQKTTGGMAANAPPRTNVSPPMPVAPNPIPQPMPPQVVYQNAPSGGWKSGIMGFLLGNSMSHNDRPYNAHNSYNQPNSSSASSTDIAGQESTGTSFLRIVVWLLILCSIGGVIWYFVKRSSANDAAAAAKRNYSL